MFKLCVQTLCLAAIVSSATAQTTLFFPRNLQKAYDKGTRSHDGKPGPNYWQNRADYKMTASLDPQTYRLSGEAEITYENNSPDTLKSIRLKLQHDRYRKGAQRSFDVAADDVEDEGTNIENLTVNGQPVDAADQRRFATFLDVQLKNKPVLPKSKTTLTVRWSYRLPKEKGAARECVCDSSSFFVPYWYPQVAVYDDLNGWADAPYTGTQEFYHDFADYDVSIRMPYGFQVWATGEWQNAEEVLEKTFYDRWKSAQKSDQVSAIFTEAELKKGGVFKKTKASEMKPWETQEVVFKFKAEGVPDFAFAASDHYNWDATSVVVDDKKKRRTFVSAAYNTQSTDYPQVARIAADGIRLMSTWLPGYPFPYPVMTVFNGDDGMEFPMMCNDASTAPNSPMTLTVHEVSHTYFPFMMGINEQDYAWMDEGWAAFFDFKLSDSLSNHTIGGVRGYSAIAGTENDVPPMVRSRNLTVAYRNAAYQRPQNAYFTLLDLLGEEKFRQCMYGYMERWKGKHPMPFDFFNTWNQLSGENLDWFWKPWFFDWAYPDLSLNAPTADAAGDVFRIQRKGSQPVPVHLVVTYADGSTQTFHQTPAVWKDGKSEVSIRCAAGKTVKSATLGLKTIPDVNANDNKWQ